MKRAALILLALVALLAQTGGNATLKIGKATISIAMWPSVASISCPQAGLEAGGSMICTATLSAPAPASGYSAPATVDQGLTVAPATVSWAANATTATVTVSRP
jgi:hypothetical protein